MPLALQYTKTYITSPRSSCPLNYVEQCALYRTRQAFGRYEVAFAIAPEVGLYLSILRAPLFFDGLSKGQYVSVFCYTNGPGDRRTRYWRTWQRYARCLDRIAPSIRQYRQYQTLLSLLIISLLESW